ncbi:DUF6364 family protein [Parafilimonas terrae]|jgi:hypothetical protein|uniref:Ribbon-helix-helix protein, copG family n=1 Tax=Parafilimonas terrae TaxID=1465490 RepID=A0A1I5WYF7_9BACT|nr:DUF6364 family protein [Parafilimonas terrae]SFQ24714.1 hypothetical protein SAMN05444277_10783 [Parafilimonas terrae]
MKTTLNLRFDKDTIEAAKEYASRKQTSISEIVEAYLKKLTSREKKKNFVSDSLIGVLKEYKSLTDEEIKTLYIKGKHNA